MLRINIFTQPIYDDFFIFYYTNFFSLNTEDNEIIQHRFPNFIVFDYLRDELGVSDPQRMHNAKCVRLFFHSGYKEMSLL